MEALEFERFPKRMQDLYNSFQHVGLNIDGSQFVQGFLDGPPNSIYIDIVHWFSSQLSGLCDIEDTVTAIEGEVSPEEQLGFFIEVSSMLKDLGCAIKSLVSGPLEMRFNSRYDKVQVAIFLCSELEAAKILALKNPHTQDHPLEVELAESQTAKSLKEMLISLKFGKPPASITPQRLFGEVEKKLRSLSNPSPPTDIVGTLLFHDRLTEKQWFQLQQAYDDMRTEYTVRRKVLITRLDVTIRSFFWSDKTKNKMEEGIVIYNKMKNEIKEDSSVKISNLLCATEDLEAIEKTSSGAARKNTTSAIHKVIIGSVPDRGGRPTEQAPPEPEVPSWEKKDSFKGGDRNQQSRTNSFTNNTKQTFNNNQRGRNYYDNSSSTGAASNNSSAKSSHCGELSISGSNHGYYAPNRGGYGPNPNGYSVNSGGYKGNSVGFGVNPSGYSSNPPSYGAPAVGFGNPGNGYSADARNYATNPPNVSPLYQPTIHYVGAPLQMGFSGYVPAGDNFHQYGMQEGLYPSQPSFGGNIPRGYNKRGSKPFRGNARGRGNRK